MSKSFREKRSRDKDLYETEHSQYKKSNKFFKRKEKVVHNALRSRDIDALVKYTEDED